LIFGFYRWEELRPESQLALLAKVTASQPEPTWALIVQLTLRYIPSSVQSSTCEQNEGVESLEILLWKTFGTHSHL